MTWPSTAGFSTYSQRKLTRSLFLSLISQEQLTVPATSLLCVQKGHSV